MNYNLGPASWVQVMDPAGLEHFLRLSTGLAPDDVDAMLAELRDNGHTSEAPVDIANRTCPRWDSPSRPATSEVGGCQ